MPEHPEIQEQKYYSDTHAITLKELFTKHIDLTFCIMRINFY